MLFLQSSSRWIKSVCLGLVTSCLMVPLATEAATLVHRFSFDTLNDSIGGATLTLHGNASLANGRLVLPSGGPASNVSANPAVEPNHARILGATSTLNATPSLSMDFWFTMTQANDWAKLYMFGGVPGTTGGSNNNTLVVFTPYVGSNPPSMDFRYLPNTVAGTTAVNTRGDANPAAITTNVSYHMTTVFDAELNTMSLYINGVLADSTSMNGYDMTSLKNPANMFLGRAIGFNDPTFVGSIDEFRIYSGALTAEEVMANHIAGANIVPEPGRAVLLAMAIGVFALRRKRRK